VFEGKEVPFVCLEFSYLNSIRIYSRRRVLFGQDSIAEFHPIEVAFESSMPITKAIEEDW
jgi:hypothetical protein